MVLSWKGSGCITHGDIAMKWKWIMWATEYKLWNIKTGKEIFHIYIHNIAPKEIFGNEKRWEKP